MKNVRKAWNGGTVASALAEAAKREHQVILAKQRFKADRIMTPEEYDAMPLVGWHMVCKDFDGFGAVAVRFMSPPTPALTPHIGETP